MFRSSTDEIAGGADTSESGHTSGPSPPGRNRVDLNESTSFNVTSVSCSSSHRGVVEGSTSSSHGPLLPRISSGDFYFLFFASWSNLC